MHVPKLVVRYACGLATVFALGLFSATACAQPSSSAGSTVEGTWYLALDAEPFGLPPGTNLPGLAQFHADGTMTLLDAGDLGAAPFPTRDTMQLGDWTRRGGQIRTSTLFLQIDEESGQALGWNRVRLRLRMPQGDTMHGVVNVSFLACNPATPFPVFFCPDPVANQQEFGPLPPVDIAVILRRLPRP